MMTSNYVSHRATYVGAEEVNAVLSLLSEMINTIASATCCVLNQNVI
jgi:hypothetical protein